MLGAERAMHYEGEIETGEEGQDNVQPPQRPSLV